MFHLIEARIFNLDPSYRLTHSSLNQDQWLRVVRDTRLILILKAETSQQLRELGYNFPHISTYASEHTGRIFYYLERLERLKILDRIDRGEENKVA